MKNDKQQKFFGKWKTKQPKQNFCSKNPFLDELSFSIKLSRVNLKCLLSTDLIQLIKMSLSEELQKSNALENVLTVNFFYASLFYLRHF